MSQPDEPRETTELDRLGPHRLTGRTSTSPTRLERCVRTVNPLLQFAPLGGGMEANLR